MEARLTVWQLHAAQVHTSHFQRCSPRVERRSGSSGVWEAKEPCSSFRPPCGTRYPLTLRQLRATGAGCLHVLPNAKRPHVSPNLVNVSEADVF